MNDSMDLPGPSVVGRLSGKPMAGQAADALQWTGSVFPARLAAQVRLFQRPIFILRYLSALDLPSETKLGCTQQELALLYAGHRLVCSVHAHAQPPVCLQRARARAGLAGNAVVRAACTSRTPGQCLVLQTGENRKEAQSIGTNRASLRHR